MVRPYDEVEGITERVIRAAIEVHRELGPGLLESVYRDCLQYELTVAALPVECDWRVPVRYKDRIISNALKVDLAVDHRVIVEVKAVEALHPVHLAQVITYLKLTGFPAGLLLNFNAVTLRAGLRRLDHPDRYQKRQPPK